MDMQQHRQRTKDSEDVETMKKTYRDGRVLTTGSTLKMIIFKLTLETGQNSEREQLKEKSPEMLVSRDVKNHKRCYSPLVTLDMIK